MKVTLVAINSKFIHSNLAVRYLKKFTRNLDYVSNIREFSINDNIQKILQQIIEEAADVVAFSCYIWNIKYVQELTRLIKLVSPETEILLGGPEVSYDSKFYMEKLPIDYVIEGEGELTYNDFIKYKLGLECIENIKGIYYRNSKQIIYGGNRELMNMNDIVFPYDSADDLKNKIVYYEASRGCPFNCKYCLSSTTHGVRFLNLERIKKEIKFLVDKNVKLIKFVDRTFNCDKNFSAELWKYLISLNTDTTFHFEISADILSEEQIQVLKKAPKGLFQFEVGVQTTNNEVLKNINRFVNFHQIEEKVLEVKRLKNIKQHLDLIAGLPGENYSSFINSFNDVYKIQPEEIQLGFLKLLKGSSMREESNKWGMKYSPYPPYEILKTKDISYEEIVKLKRVEEVLDKYYNSQKFNTILKYFIGKFETPFDFYYKLGMFFYKKGYLNRNISSADYYKVFLEFNEEMLKESNDILLEIVKFDYLKFNKKKWLPNFLNRYIDKEAEITLRTLIKENKIEDITKKHHLEKFNIDMFKFINKGKIEQGDFYLCFDETEPGKERDITKYILSSDS